MTDEAIDAKIRLIRRVLAPERVCMIESLHKDEALHGLISVLATSDCIGDHAELAEAVFRREELMSTGIGLGLAVPHVRLKSIREMVMAVGISPEGISDYASLDDKPVHLVFLIGAPEGQHTDYVQLLSAISSRAKALKGIFDTCTDPDAFYRMFADLEDTNGVA